MTTCARCGSATCGTDNEGWAVADRDVIGCRDRELANLRALLRSVTGKLEEAQELLEESSGPRCVLPAQALIDQVLEALS